MKKKTKQEQLDEDDDEEYPEPRYPSKNIIFLYKNKKEKIKLRNRDPANFIILCRYFRLMYNQGYKELLTNHATILSNRSFVRCNKIKTIFPSSKIALRRRILIIMWAVDFLKIKEKRQGRYLCPTKKMLDYIENELQQHPNGIVALQDDDPDAVDEYEEFTTKQRRWYHEHQDRTYEKHMNGEL